MYRIATAKSMHLAYSNQMTKSYKKSTHGEIDTTNQNLKVISPNMKIMTTRFPTLREPILTEQEPAF